MQKMTDALLVECPSCHASTYQKQLTAAGFQLKGSGYYVTDFKNSGSPAPSGACGSGNCGHAH
nr:FmdB family zinc ribbon protein [Jeongeupia sp. HS-3]